MIAGAAIAALLCAPSLMIDTAAAQGTATGGWMGHGMAGMHGEGSQFLMLLRSANLSPGQQAQVRQIFQSNAAPMHALRQQFEALHEQLAGKLLAPGKLGASDLNPLVEQLSRLQEQMDEHMLDTALSIRGVLTPQQLAKVAQVHQQLQQLHSQIQSLMGPEAGEAEQPN
jgi:Spy/CpxP family protein refolding chaperone